MWIPTELHFVLSYFVILYYSFLLMFRPSLYGNGHKNDHEHFELCIHNYYSKWMMNLCSALGWTILTRVKLTLMIMMLARIMFERGWLWALPRTSGALTPVRLTAGCSGTGEETEWHEEGGWAREEDSTKKWETVNDTTVDSHCVWIIIIIIIIIILHIFLLFLLLRA